MPTLRTLLAIVVVALALPVLWFLAPIQLHGHTGYVIVDGISMEPNLTRGDLVLLKESSSYEVGDVVAYRSKALADRIVLHRVHRVTNDGHYIFKGDNNDFLDGEPYPNADDLIGTQWAVMPRAGSVLLWIKEPLHAALIGAIALVLGLFSASLPSERRRRREGSLWQPRGSGAHSREQLIGTPLAIAAVCFGLWLIALGAPATKTVVDRNLYRQNLIYSWQGKAESSIAYPNGRVKTGDAVFASLVHKLKVGYRYELSSILPVDARGSAGLSLDLSSDTGWHSIKTLAAAKRFTGNKVNVEGTLDLAALERLAQAIDKETGVTSHSYAVTLVPNLAIRARVNGTTLRDSVDAPLRFTYDGQRLLLDEAPLSEGEDNSTVRTIAGAGQVERDNNFDLGIAEVSIPTARALAGGGALLAFVAFLGMIGLVLSRGRPDEPTKIAERYGDMLVPIKRMPRTKAVVTDVESFSSLAHLAERHDATIMHLVEGLEHTYLLKESGVLYRYTAQGSEHKAHSAPGRIADAPQH